MFLRGNALFINKSELQNNTVFVINTVENSNKLFVRLPRQRTVYTIDCFNNLRKISRLCPKEEQRNVTSG